MDDKRRVAGHPPTKWWVVFGDSATQRAWWTIFTKHRPGFGHCWAVTEAAPDLFLWVEPNLNGVSNIVSTIRPADAFRHWLSKGCRVIYTEFPPYRVDLHHGRQKRGHLMTCASVLGYTLGVDSRALTPYGLYKALLGRGGVELKPW